jgi:hypothetical protein
MDTSYRIQRAHNCLHGVGGRGRRHAKYESLTVEWLTVGALAAEPR